ncbi:PleD family two-component system response regulator [Rhodopila sp.]|jgi:two-component system cell cycle response regulator|uniref:PleD family two-component system response regulator n=1 Tax=Rhodopila sp. TaxID=2480087 RepID=UPI002CABC68A|nr:PleD family two-component system response regulator [Rhodopila sp.]HVZ08768.1 PleD family two-component system response regulator [Rhodopila sp.]
MTARILIVDDVPANARLLEAKLKAEYYQVATARDGFETLTIARSWQPDLILLDIMMPGMDGFECCRLLKDDLSTLHIPVMMITTLGEPGERLHGLTVGADDFLTKPVEYDTLMARVRSLVRLKRLLDEWRARGETARALGLGGENGGLAPVAGAHVLVVDDWEPSARSIQEALNDDGVVSACARTSAQAVAMTTATAFDLIIINLGLAQEDPLHLVSELRASDAAHETPLMLIAEPAEKDRLLRGFDLGASDWVAQPIDANELRARARNQIRRKFYQDRLRSDLGTALEMALTDPLTALYNQRYLRRHLGGLMANPNVGNLAIVILDADHFKAVNDRYGHPAGDQALRLISDTLRANTRVFDTLARYGGEEFVILMPGMSEAQAEAAAERLRAAVESAPFRPVGQDSAQLTVSIGVACSGIHANDAEALLRAADAALYRAKQKGRNRVEMAEPLRQFQHEPSG